MNFLECLLNFLFWVCEDVDQVVFVVEIVVEEVCKIDEVVGCLFEIGCVIGEIVELISQIVSQINLFVFNVIIEVVWVGEVGCGFVVVVNEVKVLVE